MLYQNHIENNKSFNTSSQASASKGNLIGSGISVVVKRFSLDSGMKPFFRELKVFSSIEMTRRIKDWNNTFHNEYDDGLPKLLGFQTCKN